jgi:hypothetical protein
MPHFQKDPHLAYALLSPSCYSYTFFLMHFHFVLGPENYVGVLTLGQMWRQHFPKLFQCLPKGSFQAP